MNKFLIWSLAATSALYMASCGNDDDNSFQDFDTPGGIEAIEAVNPLKVFTTGLPAAVNGQRITTDASGRVVAIGSTTITYFTNDTRADDDSFDGVAMIDNYYPIYFRLNSQGFIKYAQQIETYGEYREYIHYWITYNSNGNISKIEWKYSDSNRRKAINYSYDGPNLVNAPVVEDGHEVFRFTVSYSNDQHPNGIINKGHRWMDLDLFAEDLGYLYYAGILGIGSQKLPLKYTFDNNKDWFQTFQWTLDSEGYPQKLVTTLIEDGEYDDPDVETINFNWK